MGSSSGKTMSRSEVDDSGQRIEKRMGDAERTLEVLSRDVKTIRETLAGLARIGTAEGVDSSDRFIQGADDITTEHFDEEDRELDHAHQDSGDREHDLDRRSSADESDLKMVADAERQIETQDARAELAKAEQETLKDIEFLKQQLGRAEDARQRSEDLRRRYGQVVHSGQGSGV